MRTVLDIDRDLLEQAKTALQQLSFTATVNAALREVVEARRERRLSALREMAKVMSELDPESRQALERVDSQW